MDLSDANQRFPFFQRDELFLLFLPHRTANQIRAIKQQMKRIFLMICLVVAMIAPTSLLAQTPEEVVQRMTAELNKGDSLGMSFDFVMTIPLLGEFRSTNYTLGDKMRMEMVDHGNITISWSDGVTDWEYDSEKNEVKITKAKTTLAMWDFSKTPLLVTTSLLRKRPTTRGGTSCARRTGRTRKRTTQRRCTSLFQRLTTLPST